MMGVGWMMGHSRPPPIWGTCIPAVSTWTCKCDISQRANPYDKNVAVDWWGLGGVPVMGLKVQWWLRELVEDVDE